MDLDNGNRRLLEGLISLLRDKVEGWPTVSGENFSETENVWPSTVPTKEGSDEPKAFPYGTVDIVESNDTELSIELDASLRETTVKIVAFGEQSGMVEDLIDESEQMIKDHWNSTAESPRNEWTVNDYLGDWSFRSTDGTTPLVEEDGIEGRLRYNRSVDIVVETVKL